MEVITKAFCAPVINECEALRYAGCSGENDEMLELFHSCVDEAESLLKYNVCYCVLNAKIQGDLCDFGHFSVRSEKLAKNLYGCEHVLLFCATVGTALDRLIAKYVRLSPARAVMLQALGTERVESLCDIFCEDFGIDNSVVLKPRFSPGYGDLSLDTQKDIFSVLNCPKNIGVYLNDSLLMSPSKSVTAFAGIGGNI
ncbi:MAG: Vitamin B12 dependent methionine synthase activation subunit [Oscillospiraceae bacterium]|nr:Vitamin B12 dependent methionine synthase activation subunit [Oscillospiraceae bacterium]